MEHQRTYSEQQVKDILMKAVDLQQQGALAGTADANGLSRDQLVKMATELGIDPKYVDAAIDQVRVSQGQDKGVRFLGIPLSHTHEAVVDGELDPERFDVVMPELGTPNMNSNFSGSSQVGRSLTARVSKGFAFGPITVVSRDGKTKVTGKHSAFVGFMAGMYPAIILSFVLGAGMIAKGHLVGGLVAILGILGTGLGLFTLMARKADQAMKEVVSRVAAVVADETRAQDVRDNLARPMSVAPQDEAHVEDRA